MVIDLILNFIFYQDPLYNILQIFHRSDPPCSLVSPLLAIIIKKSSN